MCLASETVVMVKIEEVPVVACTIKDLIGLALGKHIKFLCENDFLRMTKV
jgi:hypothetical protein